MSDPLLPLLDLPGVAAAATDSRAAVDRLLSHRVLRRSSGPVSAESMLRGARASAELDGAAYQLEAVRAGAIEDPVLTGALRVSGAIGRLTDTFGRAPMQALAALHLQAASGIAADHQLGRPRADAEVGQRLQQLAGTVMAPRAAEVPGVLVAAVVHGELMALKPFAHANGIVARGAARIVLVRTGVDPKSLAVPEVGHVTSGREYAAALDRYRTGTAEGVADWLVHCCTALSAGAVEGLAICEAILRG